MWLSWFFVTDILSISGFLRICSHRSRQKVGLSLPFYANIIARIRFSSFVLVRRTIEWMEYPIFVFVGPKV